MHTGFVLEARGRTPVQLSVGSKRVQLSYLDGPSWSARLRRTRLEQLDAGVIELALGGRRWTIELDDPERFGWHVLPRIDARARTRRH